MQSEWPIRHLSAVAREVTVGFVGTMADQYVADGIPFLRSLNVHPFEVDLGEVKYISRDFHNRLQKSALRPGDVVIVRTGKPGTCAVVPETLKEANCSDVVIVRCGEALRPHFLSYWVNAMAASHVGAHTVGAVQQHFNVASAKTLRLPVPPLPVQDEVLVPLRALDEKITLLRETNATLEAIAQALFKSWFVDFDPVRARAEGRDPVGLPPEVADLFPSEFEDSELGEIPKGWRVGDVYEVANVRYGAPFASKLFNTEGDGLPLVRIRDLKDEAPGVWTPEAHTKGYRLQPGDIVVGMDGEFRAHLWGGAEAWMNQRICVFQPCNGHSAAFVRSVIAAPLAHVEATETATTVIHLGKGDIDRFRVIVPPPPVAKAFTDLCQPLYDQIVSGKQRVRTLAATRDTLLPRLMSGKLRIPQIQEAAEEVAA